MRGSINALPLPGNPQHFIMLRQSDRPDAVEEPGLLPGGGTVMLPLSILWVGHSIEGQSATHTPWPHSSPLPGTPARDHFPRTARADKPSQPVENLAQGVLVLRWVLFHQGQIRGAKGPFFIAGIWLAVWHPKRSTSHHSLVQLLFSLSLKLIPGSKHPRPKVYIFVEFPYLPLTPLSITRWIKGCSEPG